MKNRGISATAQQNPMNNSNSLYAEIKNGYPDARNINLVTQALEPLSVYGIEGGQDYVKIESARKLTSSEYTLNSQLGYISLKSKRTGLSGWGIFGRCYRYGSMSFSENVEGFYHIDLITHLGFNDEKCLFAGGLSGSEG